MYTKEEEKLLKETILAMDIVLKNCQIYNPSHSIVQGFLERFEIELNRLLDLKGEVSLGISPESLMLEGKYFERDTKVFQDIAKFFHTRAVSSVSFLKGISLSEIRIFFESIIDSRDEILKKGGLFKILASRQVTHIHLTELDYSSVIEREATEAIPDKDEEKFWNVFITNLSEGIPEEITDDSIKLFENALSDSVKTATGFNRYVYNDPEKLQQAARMLKRLSICAKEKLFEKDIENKKHMEEILDNLDPSLISSLIKEDSEFKYEHEKFMHILSNILNEQAMSNLIESIVVKENKFSDRILGILDKICLYDEKKPLIADILTLSLLDKGIFARETSLELIESIKKLALANLQNKFISKIHQNILSCVENGVEQFKTDLEKSTGDISAYALSISRKKIDLDFAEMIFELLKSEEDPRDFELITDRFFEEVPSIISHGGLYLLNEFLAMFTVDFIKKEGAFSTRRDVLASHLHEITVPDIVNSLVKNIAEEDVDAFQTASQIILLLGKKSVRLLLDAAFKEENLPIVIERVSGILSQMGEGVSDEIALWLEDKPDIFLSDIVRLLYRIDTDEALEYLKNIYMHKGDEIRKEIIQIILDSPKEKSAGILHIALKTSDVQLKNMVTEALLKLKDRVFMDMLIETLKIKNPFGSKNTQIIEAIDLLKEMGREESIPHLVELFYKKPVPFWISNDNLRVAIVYTLSEIGTDEAMDIIARGTKDKSKTVREVCQYIISEKKYKTNTNGA
ncbi:MAG: HEAT repeat domain-containing protein [Candidatus Omnitrophica bacterium]|nr:HEAT repeat domain-containing protein [Candidatus Omnitrophota bacterium]